MTTGFPEPDAAADFARARRRHARAVLAARLTHKPSEALTLVPFDDVVADGGRIAEHDLGLRSIPLASVVGTVNRRSADFDRAFRPRTRRLARRWQGIAAARRRGVAMPPIDVYRVGNLHFVLDGHHRVSVARAQGDTMIDACVRQVQTPGHGAVAREMSTCPGHPLGEREPPVTRPMPEALQAGLRTVIRSATG
jgi:hypothetical protein